MGHNVIHDSKKMFFQFKLTLFLFSPLLEEKLTFHFRQAGPPHATAGFQLPGAPGMQREPRRAAVEACVREQSTQCAKETARGRLPSSMPQC